MKEFLVVILVIGIIAFAVWRVGNGQKKRSRGRNPESHKRTAAGSGGRADADRHQPGAGSQPDGGSVGGLEACYQAYLDLEAAKHRRQAAAVILTRQAGILERIQILLGFCHEIAADSGSNSTVAGNSNVVGGSASAAAGSSNMAAIIPHTASGRSYVEGQLRAIEEDLKRFPLAKGNPMGREQYFRSLQLDPGDSARAGALLQQMKREKAHLENDEQYRFYLGILNALSAFPWSLEDSQTALREQGDFKTAFARLCRSLTETLSRAGVIFISYEEAGEEKREEWFRTLDSARSYPCALKKEDKTLLVYGRAVKAREADDKRKGRGGSRK